MAILSSVMFTCYLIAFVLLESLLGKKQNMSGLQLLGEASCGRPAPVLSPAQAEWLLCLLSTVCYLERCDIVAHPAGHLPHRSTNSFGTGTVFCSSLFPNPHPVSKCSRNVYCTRCAELRGNLAFPRTSPSQGSLSLLPESPGPWCWWGRHFQLPQHWVWALPRPLLLAGPLKCQHLEGSPSVASVLRTSSQMIVKL